jgi:hypothetical protein
MAMAKSLRDTPELWVRVIASPGNTWLGNAVLEPFVFLTILINILDLFLLVI